MGVTQVVLSLRSRHAELLQLRPPASSLEGAESTRGSVRGNAADGTKLREEPVLPGLGTMPIRLVTNGLWPAVAVSHDAAIARPSAGVTIDGLATTIGSETRAGERGGQHDPAARGEGAGGAAWVGASVLATEVGEIFDAISVALNTADPAQYDQVRDERGAIIRGATTGRSASWSCPMYLLSSVSTCCIIIGFDHMTLSAADCCFRRHLSLRTLHGAVLISVTPAVDTYLGTTA